MKNTIRGIFVMLFSFLLFGCFDVYQNISLGDNGKTYIYTQFTVSKALIAMTDDTSDVTSSLDDMIDGIPETNDILLEKGKIDTPSDAGVFFKILIDYNKENIDQEKNFLPIIPMMKDGKIFIDFTGDESIKNKGDMDNPMAELFLSQAKYHLTIEKAVFKHINKVTVKTEDSVHDIKPIDINNAYLIEIPIIFLFNNAHVVIE
jgi:hypothetical protein